MSAFELQDPVVVDVAVAEAVDFHSEAHAKYFRSILQVMPHLYASLDTSRMTALYFAVVGLDLLGEVDSIDKTNVIEWVYAMQLNNTKNGTSSAGFIGGAFMNHLVCAPCSEDTVVLENSSSGCSSCPFPHNIREDYHQGHIAMTYTALMVLTTLGDDLSRVNKAQVLAGEIKSFAHHDLTSSLVLVFVALF